MPVRTTKDWIAVAGVMLSALTVAGLLASKYFWSTAEAQAHVATFSAHEKTQIKTEDSIVEEQKSQRKILHQLDKNLFRLGTRFNVRGMSAPAEEIE